MDTETDGITIEHSLPQHLRAAGVALFEEAFGDKMRMAVPDRGRRMAFMSRVYVADHFIVALRDGQLLGMAGLRTKGEPFGGGIMDIGWDPRAHRDLLGWRGAVRAVLGLRLADHRPAADEVYVDGIAVAPAARGLGIGTRLLDEVRVVAAGLGKPWVRLDVIDTNPRAQALYERVGYRVTKVQSFRFLERWTGFGGIISMELQVGDAARPPGGG